MDAHILGIASKRGKRHLHSVARRLGKGNPDPVLSVLSPLAMLILLCQSSEQSEHQPLDWQCVGARLHVLRFNYRRRSILSIVVANELTILSKISLNQPQICHFMHLDYLE